jgi:hypothetical protein
MQSVTFQVHPAAAGAQAPTRRPAKKTEQATATVPPPKPLWQQIVGLALLVIVTAGSVVLAVLVDSPIVYLAAGAVFLLGAIALVLWAAAVLGVGLGLSQVIEILKVFFGAVKDAQTSDTPAPGGGDDGGGETPRGGGPPNP